MKTRGAALAASFALGALGCLGAPAPSSRTAAVELGTGEIQFEPLVDGQEVWLVNGSQGLHHIWTSFRASGLEPNDVTLEVDTRIDGTDTWETSRVDLQMLGDPTAAEFVGWPAVVSSPGCVRDHFLHLRITLSDRSGATGTDERVLMVRWDPPPGVVPTCP